MHVCTAAPWGAVVWKVLQRGGPWDERAESERKNHTESGSELPCLLTPMPCERVPRNVFPLALLPPSPASQYSSCHHQVIDCPVSVLLVTEFIHSSQQPHGVGVTVLSTLQASRRRPSKSHRANRSRGRGAGAHSCSSLGCLAT